MNKLVLYFSFMLLFSPLIVLAQEPEQSSCMLFDSKNGEYDYWETNDPITHGKTVFDLVLCSTEEGKYLPVINLTFKNKDGIEYVDAMVFQDKYKGIVLGYRHMIGDEVNSSGTIPANIKFNDKFQIAMNKNEQGLITIIVGDEAQKILTNISLMETEIGSSGFKVEVCL